MKISLLAVGKIVGSEVRSLVDMYVSRIVHYMPFEHIQLPDLKNSRSLTHDQQKQAEGKMILDLVKSSDFVILLDERGRQYTSREFAALIDQKANTLSGRLIFVVGGPYGFSQEVYNRANGLIALSKMTFPHEVARLLIAEQIYRAMTIRKGEPYHHD